MNLTQYQQETTRTCPSLGVETTDLAHMVLGIGSEENEIEEAFISGDMSKIKDEVGDSLWYISNYCNMRGFDLEIMWKHAERFNLNEDDLPSFTNSLSKLQDLVKKYLAYGKEIDKDKEKHIVQDLIAECNFRLMRVYNYMVNPKEQSSTQFLEEILDKNIEKLRIRFPEKFEANLAINKDSEKENTVFK